MVVFVDNISRIIAGYKVDEDEKMVKVENPVIIAAMPTQEGQMSLQLIPVFFPQILENQTDATVFEYNKFNITASDITKLEPQIIDQYVRLFSDIPVPVDTDPEMAPLKLHPTKDTQNNG